MRLLLPPDTLVGSRKNSFGSSGDRVHIDSAALYDDLAAFSVGALVKMNTLTAGRDIITKLSTTGWTLQLTDANGNFGLLVTYSMNDLSRITGSAALVTGRWQFLAATCNPSASAGDRIHLYASPDANAPMVVNEGSEGAPTATRDSDAAHTLTLLNRTGGSQGLQADVPLIWISNRVLALGELLEWQTNPLTPPPGCIGFWPLAEAGTIYDYSGREAHHSTLIQGTFLTPDVIPALQVPRGARIRAVHITAGQTVAIGQVTESELAQPMAVAPMYRLANQVAEANAAQALTAAKRLAIVQATETQLAQGLTIQKALAIGQAPEASLAQPMTGRKVLAIGQASEAELAQALTVSRIIALAQVSETELAQGVTEGGGLTGTIGQAAETQAAQPMAWAPQYRLLGQATETDLAQGATPAKILTLGQVTESEVAQGFTARKTLGVGQVVEIDLAQGMTGLLAHVILQAAETDTADVMTRLLPWIYGDVLSLRTVSLRSAGLAGVSLRSPPLANVSVRAATIASVTLEAG